MSIPWLKKLFYDTSDASHKPDQVSLADQVKNLDSLAPFRPCHYSQLFVKHNGELYPCCDVWANDSLKIGHISDVDLVEKIKFFNKSCYCHKYRLRKASDKDQQSYIQLNVEMSLACQAKCVMCSVDAPGWKGTYDYYADLEKLINKIRPSELFVQGGEILIQKKSVEWLHSIRAKFPEMQIAIATNGNVGEPILSDIKDLFDRYSISFVGFQPETYRMIMGIDIAKTMHFVDTLRSWNNSLVQLKFLVTPVNLHETGMFLKWALSKSPDRILLSDAATEHYINLDTADNYWRKIIDLVSDDLKQTIERKQDEIRSKDLTVALDLKIRAMFGIDEQFVESKGLSRNIVTHSGWFSSTYNKS